MISRDDLIEIVLTSFKEVFSKFDGEKVTKKGSHDFVSLVDTELEKVLKERLLACDSSYGFICEESDPIVKENNWIIDPIDGTTNYLSGLPFATSVAEMCSGLVVRGLVIDYYEDVIYYAEIGQGAFVLDMCTRKVRKLDCVSGKPTKIGAFGIPYDRTKASKILEAVSKNLDAFDDVKRIGPASLDICRVADNQYDCYFELDLKQWDIAAASLILHEANGVSRRAEDLFIFSSEAYPLKL